MSNPLSYEEALAYVASLEGRGWRLGLDRMQEFARRLDLKGSLGEPGGPQYIHIGGTNGKGSVTSYVQSMLVESGYSTGAFFSPYVYDPRERVQVGRRLIPKNIYGLLTTLIKPFGESLSETEFGGVTEFEFKTALGFMFWKEMECEWVALEVGLGGRLDATNIITPRCSVIVSIGLDHTAILGSTQEKIAYEKAGIIKPGVPVVVGEIEPGPLGVIEGIARDNGAELWRLGHEIELSPGADGYTVVTPAGSHAGLHPGIPGAMQPQNMALAVAALDAAGATRTLRGLQYGARKARAPGRFESARYEGRELLLDGAHNAESARVLAQGLKESGEAERRIVLLSGMVKGHEPEEFYREIAPLVDSAHFAPIDFHRAVEPLELLEQAGKLFPKAQWHPTLQNAIDAAVADAGPNDLILVTGSFYLVGEVGRATQLANRRTSCGRYSPE